MYAPCVVPYYPHIPPLSYLHIYYSQLHQSWVITIQNTSPNMKVTAIPKHKPLRGNPQTNRIRNRTRGCGAHNPWTNPNDSKYELGLQAIIIWSRILRTYCETLYIKI